MAISCASITRPYGYLATYSSQTTSIPELFRHTCLGLRDFTFGLGSTWVQTDNTHVMLDPI
ncbi:hypothetical protein PS893_00448 [Pseudomonas fluorescens]|nr:hypothetical protein PS893_00448 [Pseudomonas fluorescens]